MGIAESGGYALTSEANYIAIAQAIRDKSGGTQKYKPEDMGGAITNMSVGAKLLSLICGNINSISASEIENITAVGKYAFAAKATLTSVELPETVASIGDNAFINCAKLHSLRVLATTPPTLGENVFSGTALTHIYVPSASVGTYKSAAGWSAYSNIISEI